jgi:mono/diheme cytochrome c family protein
MFNPVTRPIVLITVLLFAGAAALMSQQKPASSKADKAPVELSGPEMFKAYCASCHGEDAKGHGPVAPALKVPPPDLTLLAKRNNGKFSADHVNTVVLHGVNTPAHGSAEMPIWGPVFVGINDQRLVILRVNKLSEYLETLQVK